MFVKLKEIFFKLFSHKHSPHKLALSCAWGMYIAFSPFPGLHTLFIFVANYLFKLHFPLVFAVASLNNPWTMIPFYMLDYKVGVWLVNYIPYNPGWEISLQKIFGSGKISLWAFFIGGNFLGICAGVLTYLLMRGYDLYYAKKNQAQSLQNNLMAKNYENYNGK